MLELGSFESSPKLSTAGSGAGKGRDGFFLGGFFAVILAGFGAGAGRVFFACCNRGDLLGPVLCSELLLLVLILALLSRNEALSVFKI